MRFVPVLTRKGTAGEVQLSELCFYLNGHKHPIRSIHNPGGKNPDSERPVNLGDGSSGTKWLDHNKEPVIVELADGCTIDAYAFRTANDHDQRDPVRWRLDGSVDGKYWTVIDDRSVTEQAVTRVRKTLHTVSIFPPWHPGPPQPPQEPQLRSHHPAPERAPDRHGPRVARRGGLVEV